MMATLKNRCLLKTTANSLSMLPQFWKLDIYFQHITCHHHFKQCTVKEVIIIVKEIVFISYIFLRSRSSQHIIGLIAVLVLGMGAV